MFVPQDTLWKTRKWHWLSGAQLPTDWNFSFAGTASQFMADVINEGLQVEASNGTGEINFNNIRHYNFGGCIFLAEWRGLQTTNQNLIVGMSADLTLPVNFNGAHVGSSTSIVSGFYNVQTNNGAATTSVTSAASFDTLFHGFEQELTVSSFIFTFDGVLDTTITTTLPTVPLQPIVFANGVGKSLRIRQLEVYNT